MLLKNPVTQQHRSRRQSPNQKINAVELKKMFLEKSIFVA